MVLIVLAGSYFYLEPVITGLITVERQFNYSDSLGEILGFRNVGETNSITSFATTITNNIAYENDYFKDSVGNEIYFDSATKEVDNNVVQ